LDISSIHLLHKDRFWTEKKMIFLAKYLNMTKAILEDLMKIWSKGFLGIN
jgi:hypothetical protein